MTTLVLCAFWLCGLGLVGAAHGRAGDLAAAQGGAACAGDCERRDAATTPPRSATDVPPQVERPAGERSRRGRCKRSPGARVPEESGPRILVLPAGFDFGTVGPGQTLEKEFKLTNEGDGALTIGAITTDCGCTAVVLGSANSRVLPPGASTALHVRLDVGFDEGWISRTVTLASDDPTCSELQLEVEATVWR